MLCSASEVISSVLVKVHSIKPSKGSEDSPLKSRVHLSVAISTGPRKAVAAVQGGQLCNVGVDSNEKSCKLRP